MGFTFDNPLQVDLSSIFNADTVASSAANGQSYPPLVSMDGSGYDYLTEAVAETNFDTGGGLPNDGLYASDTDHPNVQLAFSDGTATPNSVLLNSPLTSTKILTVTFPVPATSYSTVQLYGTSTEGSSNITVTLNYADSTTDVSSFTIPDWGQSYAAAAPVFVLQDAISRFSSSGIDHFSENSFGLYGTTSQASSAKTLNSVTVTWASGKGRFVLYGATAY